MTYIYTSLAQQANELWKRLDCHAGSSKWGDITWWYCTTDLRCLASYLCNMLFCAFIHSHKNHRYTTGQYPSTLLLHINPNNLAINKRRTCPL